jgi:hypothetical protein
MGQKLLLNNHEFNNLLNSNEIKEQLAMIPSKYLFHRPIWVFYYGGRLLSYEDNIKSLKKFEKKLTKSIIARILTSDEIKSGNNLDSKTVIRIVGNKLHIKEVIKQGEFDYEYEDEIGNNSTNT